MHTTDDLWLLTVLLWLGLSWLSAYLASGLTSVTRLASSKSRRPKPLIPRSEDDCPHCRTNPARSTPLRPAAPPPPPWPTVKSPRGRKKAIPTEGYACLNPECPYRLITDARIHALVGDGFHGHDRIPDFRCQACDRKFSARRDTALYHLRTPAQAIGITLALLAEGVAPDALQRVLGIRETTQRLWLTRAGLHAQALHEHFSQGLQLAHIQLDELFAHARHPPPELSPVNKCSTATPNALNWFRRPGREGFEASKQTTKFGLDVVLSPNDTAESAAIATNDFVERIQHAAFELARARPEWSVGQVVAEAAAAAQRAAAPGQIAALIDAARDHHPPYAAIVCDLPPTLGTEWSIQPLLRASVVLCIVEPSRADAMNLLNTVKILTGAVDPRYRVPRESILAVLNRVTTDDELTPVRLMDSIREYLGGWAPPFIATLPHDPLVRQQQINFRLPIDQRDGFRKGIDALVSYFYSDVLAGNGAQDDGAGRFGIKIRVRR